MYEIDHVGKSIKLILERISISSLARHEDVSKLCAKPRLVAVSKTKPVSALIEAYKAGQTHFGENYVQELVEKANNSQILSECPDIKWHMIGHIQSNKVKKVVSTPNIFIVETVDSAKLATALNNAWKVLEKSHQLQVFVQVNTSGEANKAGASPVEASDLVRHVITTCPELKFCGLMTIGSFDHDLSQGPNPDFQELLKCRADVCEQHSIELQDVELSMGMSHDFEHAIMLGSSNVRVGSLIFGAREKK